MTNHYPRGKLSDDDKGEVEFAVGAHQGVVKIVFRAPTLWIGMHPDEVDNLVAALLDKAKEARKQMM